MPRHHLALYLPLMSLMACEAELPASTAPTSVVSGQSSGFSAPVRNLPDFFDCVDENGVTLISAHRGGPTPGRPENSIAAFEHSVANGALLLEVDVTTSADGVLYLHHDDYLDRTTTGQGPASEASWDDLRRLSLVDENGDITAYPITRLDEALDWAEGRAILQLDIKRNTDYDDVLRVVNNAGAGERIIVIAYSDGQAGALASRFERSMISATVNSTEHLSRLEDRGLNRRHILAWTGNEDRRPNLYNDLDQQSVEVIYGTLGGRLSLDNQIAESSNDDLYAEIAASGVDILATDRPLAAINALQDDGRSYSEGLCR